MSTVDLILYFKMTDGRWLSLDPFPCRDHVISANPGRGHGDLFSDFVCHSITSWDGVVCKLVFAVTVGCLLPWAPDRDPLGWAQ